MNLVVACDHTLHLNLSSIPTLAQPSHPRCKPTTFVSFGKPFLCLFTSPPDSSLANNRSMTAPSAQRGITVQSQEVNGAADPTLDPDKDPMEESPHQGRRETESQSTVILPLDDSSVVQISTPRSAAQVEADIHGRAPFAGGGEEKLGWVEIESRGEGGVRRGASEGGLERGSVGRERAEDLLDDVRGSKARVESLRGLRYASRGSSSSEDVSAANPDLVGARTAIRRLASSSTPKSSKALSRRSRSGSMSSGGGGPGGGTGGGVRSRSLGSSGSWYSVSSSSGFSTDSVPPTVEEGDEEDYDENKDILSEIVPALGSWDNGSGGVGRGLGGVSPGVGVGSRSLAQVGHSVSSRRAHERRMMSSAGATAALGMGRRSHSDVSAGGSPG
ncbi:unnamed protein product, partial [Choristocarpus tenellus]